MQYSQTIYKKDTKGKIRSLTLSASNGEIIQESGLLEGKKIKRSKMAKPKNVGKVNETSTSEQAIKEVKAKLTEKIKKGYFETIEDAENITVVKPMLAQVYEDRVDEITFPCYVQPKLDGMRCIDDGEIKLSRENTPILNLNHIKVNCNLEIVVDGELYVHGESFQTNMKYIKKYRKGLTERIKFWVYDIIASDQQNISFEMRNKALKNIVSMSTNLVLVPTHEVFNIDEIKSFHKEFLAQGFEGTMVRWGNESYEQGKRSKYLLKYKDFYDLACKIIDVLPSDADPTMGVVHCKNDKGEFGCGMKFSHEERREILINKNFYIGQTAEVRFFEYTDDGLPRFPVFYGVRLDK